MLRTGLKAQLKAVLAKHGLRPPVKDLWGVSGPIWPGQLDLPRACSTRIESIRDLVEVYDREIDMLEREIHRQLKDHAGYKAIQAIPGVGRTVGAIMVAEIGDISRFPDPQALCSWAGLTSGVGWRVRRDGVDERAGCWAAPLEMEDYARGRFRWPAGGASSAVGSPRTSGE